MTAAAKSPDSFTAAAASTSTSSQSRRDIRTLTSLRLFPAFAVVLYHAGEYFSCWHGVVSSPFVFEYAVTFFFVLSGFILTLNYSQLGDFRAACKFYLARFARVWPAHACSLALLLFLIPEIFTFKGSNFPVFISNLFLFQSWIPSWRTFFSYNAPSWTNSTEFFFYLCFPVLLIAMRKKWWLPLLFTAGLTLASISFCNLFKLPEFDPTALSYQGLICIHPIARVLEFCCGMLAATVYQKKIAGLSPSLKTATLIEIGIVAFMIATNLLSKPLRYASLEWAGPAGAFWLQNSSLSLLCFCLLIPIFAMEKGLLSRVLIHPLPVRLGELSFGVYMLHGVILAYLGVNFPQAQSLAMCLSFMLLVFIAAHLMGELLEKPARNQMLALGNKLIGRIFPQSAESIAAQKAADERRKLAASKPETGFFGKWKKHLLIAELIGFAALIYLSLPTLHQISLSEARAQTNGAALCDLEFAPYLKLLGANAQVSDQKVRLDFFWQALKPEEVNFTVTAILRDTSNSPIGSTIYLQDGRRSTVGAGTCWSETAEIVRKGSAKPASVLVMVSRRKRETLHYAGGPADCSFVLNID